MQHELFDSRGLFVVQQPLVGLQRDPVERHIVFTQNPAASATQADATGDVNGTEGLSLGTVRSGEANWLKQTLWIGHELENRHADTEHVANAARVDKRYRRQRMKRTNQSDQAKTSCPKASCAGDSRRSTTSWQRSDTSTVI